jgi:hypothetical protein
MRVAAGSLVNGKAKPMRGWLIHKDERLQQRLSEVMHNVVWKEWKQQYREVRECKPVIVANQIREYLKVQPESVSSCSTRRIKAELRLEDVSKMTFNRAVQLVVEDAAIGWSQVGRTFVRGSALFGDAA